MAGGPGHAVGLGASVQVAGDFEGAEVEDDDVVVGGAGDEGPVAVGLHLDAGGSVADGDALGDLAGGGVEDDEVGAAEEGDEDVAAVRGELEAVGSVDVGGEGVDDFFGGEVDDGDGSVLGIAGPELPAIGGYVKAFGPAADGDESVAPGGARRAARGRRARGGDGLEGEDTDRVCVDRDDALLVGGDADHVGVILPGAKDQIDFAGDRIVGSDCLGCFAGEPDFSSGEGEAVRAAEGAEVNRWQCFAGDEVDDVEGVVGSAAVVGDVGGGTVGGGDDLVGVGADGGFGDDIESRGVDDGEGVTFLGEDEERGLGLESGERGEEGCG